ncbi:hypothetical protein BU26DRAFT_240503 [Trematosphaeria pertusa]|uniref:N-acetyltransferase domain-containing protein n=1 Tax=Trematosphaeria pertusa TaxID=390896 RepID=A0A6A6IMZ7_9PLEO|nr:uncharacterized protein BU26DRAFT_240503 [Trematosphaeria pertusa]KAF2251619.1 hypothetical protein BU26DRAFT_240503 [Trematosphaeria pertusa]
MAANTNTKTPNQANPFSLPPRYEIRKLGPEHFPWANAIVVHSNLFHSPVWPNLYPDKLTERAHAAYEAGEYLWMHQINSGMSFGVFDTAYTFKCAESKAAGGKLYWDKREPGIQDTQGLKAEGMRLLEQMDFPLVSVALAYDAANPLDMEKMGPLMAAIPHFGLLYHILATRDTRDPASWQPKAHGEVLLRNATSTRHDYEGEGLMAGLARWLMRESDARGYRGIQIECVNDAVDHVWSKPPSPYEGILVSEFHTGTWKDEEGNLAFAPTSQRVTKVYVDLKPKA